jgi:hypothetical protein
MSNKQKIDPSWVPFYFEGNLAWGWINTPEDWERVKFQYKDQFDPSLAKQYNGVTTRGYASFGFYTEYNGTITLKEWAEKLNMSL